MGSYFGLFVESAYIINWDFISLTPGLKLGYKHQVARLFAIDIFISHAIPFYYEVADWPDEELFFGLMPITIAGVRFVLEAFGPDMARSADPPTENTAGEPSG